MRPSLLFTFLMLLTLSGLLIFQMEWLLSGVDKLAYIGWRFWLVIKAFDQKLLWALLSIFVLIVASWQIAIAVRSSIRSVPDNPQNKSEDNISKWTSLFSSVTSREDEFARWNLAESLFLLYARIYSQRYGVNLQSFKTKLLSDNIDIPIKIKRYLRAGCQNFASIEKRPLIAFKRIEYPLDLDPADVITHLEELYEQDI